MAALTDPVAAKSALLTVNGGSSSVKFALFTASHPPVRLWSNTIERLGSVSVAASPIFEALKPHLQGIALTAIAHRIVHGGLHLIDHFVITPEKLDALRAAVPFDTAHLPREIELIETFQKHFPDVPQIACLDTAFHRNLPRVATLFPIPRRFDRAGIRRFGFHGLSYTYLMSELRRRIGDGADGRTILAHLGSGASMAAIHHSKPIDTTMGFTPTAGLVMGTRPGDLDPGLLLYLSRSEKMSPDQLDDFITRECGMIGVSDTSADMRDLIGRRATDPRAAEAVQLFCYRAKQYLGSLTAALGGLDTLVFSGGIGEHSAEARAGICEGLEFLGLHLDPTRNNANASLISSPESRIPIHVIPTDEEIVMARITNELFPTL